MARLRFQPISSDDVPLSALGALTALYAGLAVPAALQMAMPHGVWFISVGLSAALITLSAIDLKTMRLPDIITLPLILLGIVLAALLGWDTLEWRILSAAMGYGFLFVVARLYETARGRPGLGLGDAKLLAASGAWTGAEGLASVLLCACVTALLAVGVTHLRKNQLSMSTAIPFGPFLAAGTWIVWLYGPLA